jgi:hypothetical protein
MDLEETEDRYACAGEGQMRFNRLTDQPEPMSRQVCADLPSFAKG